MRRNDWESVYENQRRLLSALADIDEIFLGGGTALQCYVLPEKYRESEDLDFFFDHFAGKQESARVKRLMVERLRSTPGITIINDVMTEQGTQRIACGFDANDEVVKIELLDFTAARYGDLNFIAHADFPRIENYYNLLLYKLKALHDRKDTVKDLFDLYFIFKEIGSINIRNMLEDWNLKFAETTGYAYSEKELLEAFNVANRLWDIVPTSIARAYWDDIKTAVEDFRRAFIDAILSPETETLDFTFKTYLQMRAEENGVTQAEFLDFFETNAFIEMRCRMLTAR